MISLKDILLSEKHDLSNPPEDFEVPDVNPNSKKFVEASEVKMNKDWIDSGPENWEAEKWDKTASTITIVKVERLKKLSGKVGENRKWHDHKNSDQKWFGNYPLERWQGFVKEIAKNGINWPVVVSVEKNGEAFLHEGNHRLAVYDLLGISHIPTRIWWFGNVQGTEKDPFKDIFYEKFPNGKKMSENREA